MASMGLLFGTLYSEKGEARYPSGAYHWLGCRPRLFNRNGTRLTMVEVVVKAPSAFVG